MTKLRLADGLPLPSSTATQKLAWLGTTGSGKTYGASKLAEEFWRDGAQFVVLDPVGVWYGLRLDKSGKKPSALDIPIFGGLHGDIPLESTSGALIADLIVDKNLSVILDVSQFESDAQKARFAGDFSDRFFFRKKAKPSAVHLFIEECQEFVPQNPQRGEERMLHSFVRMQKLGRNFGIGSSYITQRPQEVNKKALNMAQTLFVFRTTGTHERTAIEKWIEDKSLDQSIAQDLPKIATGTCHVWSPEFLKISETVKILEKETFNASATPEVGKKARAVRLSDIDLNALQGQMAETIQKAKEEDPKELRRQIASLKSQLTAQEEHTKTLHEKAPMGVSQWLEYGRKYKYAEYFEKRILEERDKEWEAKVFDMQGEWLEQIQNWFKIMNGVAEAMKKIGAELAKKKPFKMTKASVGVSPASIPTKTPVDARHKDAEASTPAALPTDAPQGMTEQMQRVLNAIAWCESISMMQPPNELVAALSGYSHARSKGYTAPRAALKEQTLVDYPTVGAISLTATGRQYAQAPEQPLTQAELHAAIISKLDAPERKVLQPLLRVHPEAMSNTDLSQTAGYSHERSKGYTAPRARLRSYGFIEYASSGGVKAADILFL